MNKLRYSTAPAFWRGSSAYESHDAAKAWHEMGASGAEDTSDKPRTHRGEMVVVGEGRGGSSQGEE